MTQETKSRLPKSATSRPAGNTRPGARSGGTTKKAQLIQMLSRKAGADIVTISDKLGWLPHTTRAALSRLRKTGYSISSAKSGMGRPTIYCITCAPDEQSAR